MIQTATNDFAQAVGTGDFANVYRTEGALPSLPEQLSADADAAGGGHAGRGGGRGSGRGGGRGGRGRDGGVAREVLKDKNKSTIAKNCARGG